MTFTHAFSGLPQAEQRFSDGRHLRVLGVLWVAELQPHMDVGPASWTLLPRTRELPECQLQGLHTAVSLHRTCCADSESERALFLAHGDFPFLASSSALHLGFEFGCSLSSIYLCLCVWSRQSGGRGLSPVSSVYHIASKSKTQSAKRISWHSLLLPGNQSLTSDMPSVSCQRNM